MQLLLPIPHYEYYCYAWYQTFMSIRQKQENQIFTIEIYDV